MSTQEENPFGETNRPERSNYDLDLTRMSGGASAPIERPSAPQRDITEERFSFSPPDEQTALGNGEERPRRPRENQRPERAEFGRHDDEPEFLQRSDRLRRDEPDEDFPFRRPDRNERGGRDQRPSFAEDFGEEEYDEEEEVPTGFASKIKHKAISLLGAFSEWSTKKKVIVIAVVVVALITIIALLSNIPTSTIEEPSDDSATAQPEEPVEEPTVEPVVNEWDVDLEGSIGSVAVTIDGMQIVSKEFTCNVVAREANGSEVEPENGNWCVFKFDLSNLSNSVLTASSQRFKVFDIYGDEFYYAQTTIGDLGGNNTISKLVPNETVSGFVYFDVPAEFKASNLEFNTFGRSDNPVVIKINPIQDKPVSPTPTPSPNDESTPSPDTTPPPADDEQGEASTDEEECVGLFAVC